MNDVEKILARFKAAETRKTNWDTLYQEALDYAAPHRQIYYQTVDGANKNNADKVFDSTSSVALDSFVSNLQSSLFPPVKEWIQLKAGEGVAPEKRQEADQQLAHITQVMFDYLKISNFDTQISTSFSDLALGVGALLACKGTKENPLHFTSVHIAEIYLEEGPNGRIDTAFRKCKMPIRNVKGTWEDADLPDDYEALLAANPDDKVTIIEAVIADDIQAVNVKEGYEEIISGYRYVVIDEKSQKIIVDRTQESTPWVIFRWLTLPGEIYARGPLIKALPDIKTLNKVKELLLKKASRDIYGLYTVLDDGAVNLDNIRFNSMTFIPVESNGGTRGASIMPLPPAGDAGGLTQFLFNDLQNSIYKTMFAEPLGRVDLPVKTATEIAYRQQELAKKIGAAFGKLQFELMAPLVNRILFILDEMGLIDLGGFKVDGRIINITYMSPLAMAQDQDDFMAVTRYAETIQALYGPQVMMAMAPPDKVSQYLAQKLHVPQDLLPTEQDIAVMKQAILQQAVQKSAQDNAPVPINPADIQGAA
jgi:hypothetical protein